MTGDLRGNAWRYEILDSAHIIQYPVAIVAETFTAVATFKMADGTWWMAGWIPFALVLAGCVLFSAVTLFYWVRDWLAD
jgi:hypothetical protein